MSDAPIPQRIHRDDSGLIVTWAPDHVASYPARWLRLHCHCAVCREEMTGRPLLDPASVPEDVKPLSVELVGGYGIRIRWSDGHDTGIYTYRYLAEICPCERCSAEREGAGGAGATPDGARVRR